ncbi:MULTISPECIES: GntR family transcriptional regulator [Phyllobacteriaceae]|uniref:GntR family transcriptional regulator n=1 Tax=Phyllobacterium phragmitis TaxID=2670329 RepID=A0ABQ0H4P8_9HYPH|nr:GntR family transcriptional regulator [Mesorhizobium sp. RMAD-H1]MBB2974142.1 GntR family transcriptional regulator [Mesorhizobium sp. RMAD-H1]
MREASEIYALNNELPTSRFSNRPLYLQVRDAIAQRIVSGEWQPRTAIPNETDLAREFGVSPGTMRKALDLAEAERLLTRRQGRGTFVNDQSSEEYAARYSNIRSRDGKRMDGEVEVLSVYETTVSESEGMRLRLRARDRVHHIRRVWMENGRPYMLEDVVLSARLFPGIKTHAEASQRLAVLAQQFGVLLGRGDERITISNAEPDVASALHVASGTAVMRLDRVIYTLQGVPAEWRLAQCLTDEGRYYMAQFS